MAEPTDGRLFVLMSAVAEAALAFIQRRTLAKQEMKPYEDWPVISWSDNMPDFTFFCSDPPINYKEVFGHPFLWLGRDRHRDDRFDFEEQQLYQEVTEYLRSEPRLASHLFPEGVQESILDSAIKQFLLHAIDRYIHATGGTFFDSEQFLEIYLPLEAGLLLEELPIEIQTPILLVNFSSDSYDFDESMGITRMSESMQLARARRDHGTHDVNEYLLEQASHTFVLKNHTLPNSDYRRRFWGYSLSESSQDIVDTFFACLRIVTTIETGYAQVLFVPVGWAHGYSAHLPPLEGITIRKYPPTLQPVGVHASGGVAFPRIADHQVERVRALLADLTSIQRTSAGSRIRLVIKRLNSCYMREEQEDAILDATIGLEILLSDGGTQEVTHKLALRLAALSSLVPGYEGQASTIFRNMKRTIYPFRSAVVHGDLKKAHKTREIEPETGPPISTVNLAMEYLSMAVQAIAAHPEYLTPNLIDERLLLNCSGAPRL